MILMMKLRTYGRPPFGVAVIHGGPGARGEMAPVARELAPDGGVLEPLQTKTTLQGQIEELRGSRPKVAITDQGYRGRKYYGETEIVNARDLRRQKTAYRKRKVKRQLKRRSAIEPVIEHLKSGHRLSRNYLSGVAGDNINVMLAAAGYNFKRLLRKLKYFLLDVLRRVFAGSAGQIALETDF